MTRLPTPGSDSGEWGTILNDYLSAAHKADGTLKDSIVTSNNLAPNAVTVTEIQNQTITEAKLDPAVVSKLNAVAGPTGATGPTGASGTPGTPGATGTTGQMGATGATGPSGPSGNPGIPGSQGATGATGSAGNPGANGATGATGPTGTPGATGATGPKGDDGEDGTSVTITGSVASAANLPNDLTPSDAGKGYITSDDGHLHVWSGASFTDVGTVRGPQGDDGATGVTGPQGATGPSGVTGNAGSTGATGPSGSQGPSGTPGTPGLAGATGATGPSGPSGANGVAGATGSTGPTGNPGSQGATGAAGVTGATGPVGATGPAPDVASFVQKSGDSMSGDLQIYKPYALAEYINTNTAQYSGAGFKAYNEAATLATAAGVQIYAGIEDAGSTQSYMSWDVLDNNGGYVDTLLSANLNTHYITVSGSLDVGNNQIVNVAAPTANSHAATKEYVDNANTAYGVNAQTGTTYTLQLSDAGKFITLTNASPVTLTVPAESSVNFAVGTRISLAQIGAGQVTVVAAGGVSISADPGLKIAVQNGGAELVKLGADWWLLVGRLAA